MCIAKPGVTKMRDMIVMLVEKDVFLVINNHRTSQGLCDGIRVYSSLVFFFFFKRGSSSNLPIDLGYVCT